MKVVIVFIVMMLLFNNLNWALAAGFVVFLLD